MRLSPREHEGLLVQQAGSVAQRRLARGVRLNYPESVALIASVLQELVRDGWSVSQLMEKGRTMLGIRQVLPGVPDMVQEVQIEATFADGTKLVTVHKPIARQDGDLDLALYGSFLPVPPLSTFTDRQQITDETAEVVEAALDVLAGEVITQPGNIVLNEGRPTALLNVTNLCDRPVQVGSHYHFTECNRHLRFDRVAAIGMRLNIPAGTAVRFEPGESKQVNLVQIGGCRVVRGGNGLCRGAVTTVDKDKFLKRVLKAGFQHHAQGDVQPGPREEMNRQLYAHMYGPTAGDKVRLGDTSLVLEVERDMAVYGDECKFGGGKVLRESMGQAADRPSRDVLDTVITNALVVDAIVGIVKGDIGIKDGFIVGIGKAGNPETMNGVDKRLVVGACTEVIAGEGLLVTAGALDGHVHFICPQLAGEAIASGVTTMFGGGTGPATGSKATTCTPGPNHIRDMMLSTDSLPLNFGFTGKGNTSCPSGVAEDLREQVMAGAMGLKLHEDWGSTPSAIDTCLRAADEFDIQVMIHTDTLNESACVEDTIDVFKGRTIHTYHTEGAGGGHAPDILRVVGERAVLPSSTNPTRPYTVNTMDEHLDMLMVCHHLDSNLSEDVCFAESRIRAETISAEDVLQDVGAISMMSSDSQAMGRVGEVITRTWQTADKMKIVRGRLPEEKGDNDNIRIKRYLAKYTINPALTHGMAHLIGSLEDDKMADLVLWKPAFFGAKPEMVLKSGQITWSQMGLANASIPTPEPVQQREMFGACGKSPGANSVVFVSKVSLDRGIIQGYGLSKRAVAVSGCRRLTKADMVLNDLCPVITVDPQSYRVHLLTTGEEGEKREHLTCPPSSRLPLAQRYFLF
ncbi:uncharacterized protein LOC112557159 [Pomacea canaliculata]|uniref:uncharacterized protein LOC112557159 n=1 Tax=Pomacea canaliculata TaxID=400727 RepID=UPI000D738376|nr:uncharacterized protein LOC112557159 [Pomacea canaliculata]XP_025082636.1 uncharacterized protein LOC112557159 [Pomacea canaliculata]